jgi:hypothetical protein
MNWDSGQKNGHRIIRGGRQPVRNALYMCAVSAITGSDSFGQTYKRLVKRGKKPKNRAYGGHAKAGDCSEYTYFRKSTLETNVTVTVMKAKSSGAST